ncbi:acyltransferase [Aeromonas caviae]|uniref:acyltransferase n=1 Tax=Aeromonas caviae TaxID=648 RepID=UPI0029D9E759|nr:acyltransferase [Aeromonas caviae]MDX7821960.1 acyltransferase [Aeromonas caviae]
MYESTVVFIRRLRILIWFLFVKWSFKKISFGSYIYKPTSLSGLRFVSIGRKTGISVGAWIMADNSLSKNVAVNIGDNNYIGRYLHLICFNRVVIGNNVLIADKVYISDNVHNYQNVSKPIKEQGISIRGAVEIGDGAWVGENVSIIGARIGKGAVISANAVVLSDIPDFCVAGGIPAKIIKKYNFETASWERIGQ